MKHRTWRERQHLVRDGSCCGRGVAESAPGRSKGATSLVTALRPSVVPVAG